MRESRVKGKVALVTGAASGIGRAAALTLARHGASVLCADLAADGAERVAAEIRDAGGAASACRLDVTMERDWDEAIERLRSSFGPLDILVNSAGISHARPVAEMSLDEWRQVMAINLDGAFLGTRAAVRAMRKDRRSGSIINLSSASGLKASPGASAYCASKAAVCMFTKAIAKECIGDGIRVNTVCPAGVRTPMWTAMPFFRDLIEKTGSEDEAFRAMAEGSLHGRFADPAEIAQAILYLASDESLYVTGTDLVIDGGYTA